MSGFGNKAVDRRLSRIERWLKRAAAACRCGSWSDALMEIECLEAETKSCREELWKAAEHESARDAGRAGPYLERAVKVLALASAMVLTAVIPLSTEAERSAASFAVPGESLALLSSVESDIINALRESLSDANRGRVLLTVELPQETPEPQKLRGAAAAAERKTQTEVSAQQDAPRGTEAVPEVPGTAGRRPSVDEVISLIQVGQRALRMPEPAVRVVPGGFAD
ncbi:MAG: hypothetical protein LBR87_09330 [Synergistaceae bacterium]|jgi:hypothetical protein|nr:hypothetical protein [Synergistaceae bacterium]